MKHTDLSSRMKFYEKMTGNLEYQPPYLPIIVRLDGRAFHSLKLNKPFDNELVRALQFCTEYLVKETNALIGYHQSDEISLLLYNTNIKSQIYFNGRTNKINSILASTLSVIFNTYFTVSSSSLALQLYIKPVVFDCRCFMVPTRQEAINYFIWREEDAVRNSIQMVAQANFSPKELHCKSCNELQEMLFTKGINWNNYPDEYKRGSYFHKVKLKVPFSKDEIDKLPSKHEAKTNPNLLVERQIVQRLRIPRLTQVEKPIELFFKEINEDSSG